MTRPAGVRVQRVRPAKSGLVQRVQRVEVGGCAANIYKTKQPPWRARENRQTALRAEKTVQPRLWREEMHPYPRLRRYFSTGKRLT